MDLIRERMRARGHQRACFGGDSQSQANQSTSMTDARVTGGNGSLNISGDGNTVNTSSTDHGAVLAGADLSKNALNLAGAVTAIALLSAEEQQRQTRQAMETATKQQNAIAMEAMSATGDAFGSALSQLDKAYETAKAGDQRVTSMVAMAVIGLAAITVLPALFGKK